METKPNTAENIPRAKKAALKFVVVALIVLNVLVVLPGAVFSVILGQYTPTITAIILSVMVWAVGVRLIRARRAAQKTEATEA
ncbi:hypothetical protein [Saccharopolyspora shandongensis]|uniref:hypothetical protein n=1 Tax=Saccharopolyspora shandongensis TaxID=418495 RepID=UPI0033C73848